MAVRHSAEIEEAENGHIVRVSHDEEGGPGEPGRYVTKRFVAHSLPEAQQIAGDALSGKLKVGKKVKPRSSRKKMASSPEVKTALRKKA